MNTARKKSILFVAVLTLVFVASSRISAEPSQGFPAQSQQLLLTSSSNGSGVSRKGGVAVGMTQTAPSPAVGQLLVGNTQGVSGESTAQMIVGSAALVPSSKAALHVRGTIGAAKYCSDAGLCQTVAEINADNAVSRIPSGAIIMISDGSARPLCPVVAGQSWLEFGRDTVQSGSTPQPNACRTVIVDVPTTTYQTQTSYNCGDGRSAAGAYRSSQSCLSAGCAYPNAVCNGQSGVGACWYVTYHPVKRGPSCVCDAYISCAVSVQVPVVTNVPTPTTVCDIPVAAVPVYTQVAYCKKK